MKQLRNYAMMKIEFRAQKLPRRCLVTSTTRMAPAEPPGLLESFDFLKYH